MSHYNSYGKMAEANLDNIVQNGRYYAQQEAEKKMPRDVLIKLPLNAGDSFLDVGCGMGVNLKEALKYTKNCSACDHENITNKLKMLSEFSDVNFYPGNFLDLEFSQQFSKILIYGVVPTLPDRNTLYAFLDKGVSLLKDDGLLLIGDISNIDKKRRFLKTKRGQEFQKKWEENCKKLDAQNPISKFISSENSKTVIINDKIVLDLVKRYRDRGFQTYLLNQPQNLPFGNTREDMLIVGPEYQDL